MRKQFYGFRKEIEKRFDNLNTEGRIRQIPNSWKNINYSRLDRVDKIEIGVLTTLFLESFAKKHGKIKNLTELLFDFGIDPRWEFILATAKNIQIDRVDYIGNFFGAITEAIKVRHLESAGKYNFLGSKNCSVDYINYALRDFAEFSEDFKFNTINKLEEYGFAFSKNAEGEHLQEANEQFGVGSSGLRVNHIHRLGKLGLHNSVSARIGKLDRADYDFAIFSKDLIVEDAGMLDDCGFTKSLNGRIGKLSYSDGGLGFFSKGINIGEWHRGTYFELWGSEDATVKKLLFEKMPEWKLNTQGFTIGDKNDTTNKSKKQ
ncbi:hypothetical protein A3K73_07590 [Candidatus Pacearchaeota archaeon RBG_13_36_9]|nr:MAG: hypothetical protein A3K73_07590 [Candidatus Pacearchaeota archaeon RBG_13_36_9]